MFRRILFSVGLHIFVRVGVAADATDVDDAQTAQNSRRLSVLEGAQVNILYLKSDPFDNPGFRDAVSNITGGETDYFNASRAGDGTIPTVEFMSSYGCVMVHTAGLFEERGLLGDRLARYVDNGGTIVFGDGFTGGGFSTDTGVGGAIMDEEYSPIGIVGRADELNSGDHVYLGDGTTLLYENVNNFESTINNVDGDISLQGDGMQDGSYSPDGTLAAAYRPDFRVVYLNGAYCWGFEFPALNCPGDDHPRRWANACSVAFVTGSRTRAPSSSANTPSPSVPPMTIAPVTASPTRAPERPIPAIPDPTSAPRTPAPMSAIPDTSGPTDIVAAEQKGKKKRGKKDKKKWQKKIGKKDKKSSNSSGSTKEKKVKKRNGNQGWEEKTAKSRGVKRREERLTRKSSKKDSSSDNPQKKKDKESDGKQDKGRKDNKKG
jgi:hypothetical protein